MKVLLIASVAFALFILCPRMAGMTKVISDASNVSLVKVVVVGTVVSLPLIIAMALVFARYGACCGSGVLCNYGFRSGICNARDKYEGGSGNTHNRIVRAFRC